jgi:hypothetical protein
MIMLLNPGKKRKRRKSFRRRGGWSCRMVKHCRRRKKSTRAYFGRAARLSAKTSAIPFAGGSIPVAANRGGRRRRRRNSSFNYRRKHRNYSHWIPAYRNPQGIIGASTRAFDLNLVKSAIPVIGGVIGARFVTEKLAGIGAVPSFLKSGIGGYVLSLVGAGLAYTGAKLALPKYANSVLFGGSIYVMSQVLSRYVFPMFGYTPMLTGMDSYLTVSDAARARPLNGFLGDDEMDGLGDYLTPANAAGARPLMGLDHMTSEELAGLASGGMSAVEDIAGEELE